MKCYAPGCKEEAITRLTPIYPDGKTGKGKNACEIHIVALNREFKSEGARSFAILDLR